MPSGMLGTRTKYIHSVGCTGKVKFVPTASSAGGFSGIFKGADQGLIRLSVAANPTSTRLLPGMIA